MEEAEDRDILFDKAPWWLSVFPKFAALYRLETKSRQDNLSVKRRTWKQTRGDDASSPDAPETPTPTPAGVSQSSMDVHVEQTNPGRISPTSPQTQPLSQTIEEHETQQTISTTSRPFKVNPVTSGKRVASNASIAAPDQDSGKGPVMYAVREKECDSFANDFCSELIGNLWRKDGLGLDWVIGRRFQPKLVWRNA